MAPCGTPEVCLYSDCPIYKRVSEEPMGFNGRNGTFHMARLDRCRGAPPNRFSSCHSSWHRSEPHITRRRRDIASNVKMGGSVYVVSCAASLVSLALMCNAICSSSIWWPCSVRNVDVVCESG